MKQILNFKCEHLLTFAHEHAETFKSTNSEHADPVSTETTKTVVLQNDALAIFDQENGKVKILCSKLLAGDCLETRAICHYRRE